MAAVPRLEGIRIVLDRLDPKNISTSYLAWMKDPEVVRYLANPDADYSPEAISTYVKEMNKSPDNFLFGIFLKENSTHIGNIKIGDLHPKQRFADLGLIIGVKEFWGQGLGTESIELAVRFAFETLKLNKLIAGVLAPNQASYKAFRKAGFREVGCYERHWKVNEKYVNSFILERCA